jgi:hypothetical protein
MILAFEFVIVNTFMVMKAQQSFEVHDNEGDNLTLL